MWIAAWLSQKRRAGLVELMPKSRSSFFNHSSSPVVAAMARYSALADDLEMVVCFFAFQETKDSPRKTQKPVTDLRVSKQEPQSASEKALR